VFIDPPVYIDGSKQRLEGHLPSIGICILAAIAEREGYKTSIIDAIALQMSIDKTAIEVKDRSPKYVGISAMTHNINCAAFLASAVKKLLPEVIILLGGVHITAAAKETLKKYPDCFDFCIIGEGELTLIELLNTLECRGDASKVSGLAFMRNGHFVQTDPREKIKNLDELPFPAWHLLPDLKFNYGTTFISSGNRNSNHLITSRGCPGKCAFCDTTVHGNRVRGHSADYVIEMIDTLHKKYKVNDIQFNDDTFVSLRKRMYEICDRLIQKNYKVTWCCDARASDVTPEGLSLMKAAGCWQIAYGIETGSTRIMKILNKRVTLEQIRNAIKWTKSAGISTKGFFILGHPTETRESIKKTIDLMLSLDLDVVGITFFTAYPGSPIYHEIHKYGNFNPDWKNANTYQAGNFVPRGFSLEELTGYRKLALRNFYFRPSYILKQMRQIRKPYEAYKLISGGCKAFSKYVLSGFD